MASVLSSLPSCTTVPTASGVVAADVDTSVELESGSESDCEHTCDYPGSTDQPLLYKSEMQVIEYIGGYIVQKLHWKKAINCEECYSALVSDKQSVFVKEKQLRGLRSAAHTITGAVSISH